MFWAKLYAEWDCVVDLQCNISIDQMEQRQVENCLDNCRIGSPMTKPEVDSQQEQQLICKGS